MKKFLIIIGLLIGLPVSIVAIYGLSAFIALSPSCGYEPTGIEARIGDETNIVVLQVNCGATTSYVEWVVVQHVDERLGRRNDRLVVFEGEVIELESEPGLLTIQYREDPGRSHQVFNPLSEYDGFSIDYVNVGHPSMTVMELLKAPEQYDGQSVSVRGFAAFERENTNIVADREAAADYLDDRCVGLVVASKEGELQYSSHNGQHVIVTGEFEANRCDGVCLWTCGDAAIVVESVGE